MRPRASYSLCLLKVPIELPSTWTIPEGYSLRDAQAALLSEDRGSVASCLSFPILQGLPGTDYDALVFSDEQVNEESSDVCEGEGSAGGHGGVAPSGKITEIMEDVQLSSELTLVPLKSLRLALPAPPVSREEPAL